ncbi:uncharacterized protein BP5553_09702 [Venustampulla echinocandica]|uniref:Uncharacterized protein n=1 Tax=Venustampulla echinocandica TaxID=2656787 RepID=A0A370TBS7_9HELO|nr:uncharacterized protein BP5553_09702 [Venustampulla echinocandica]RDL31493.1 hypothetical protein BP5553_09702 [Venustampulla echinocandica]
MISQARSATKYTASFFARRNPPTPNETGFEGVLSQITQFRPSIETQILKTCRSIYTEANYVMLKMNLLVKVIAKMPDNYILPILIVKRVPILELPLSKVKNFKAFVMSHEMTIRGPERGIPFNFILRHRSLDHFCRALELSPWQASPRDELVSHTVALIDPYEGESLPNSPAFYSRELEEKLISPYSAALRGFPDFKIKGAISEDLSAAAVEEITRPLTDTPESVLHEVEELKSKGNEFFRNGDGKMASQSWTKALFMALHILGSPAGEKVQNAGGMTFLNRMVALYFDCYSNYAQNYLKSMRENATDHELVRSFGNGFFNAIYGALGTSDKFPNATWEPSDQQIAKVFYREAVGCRLIGEGFLGQAETAIQRANHVTPGDVEIERERERISRWRRSVHYMAEYSSMGFHASPRARSGVKNTESIALHNMMCSTVASELLKIVMVVSLIDMCIEILMSFLLSFVFPKHHHAFFSTSTTATTLTQACYESLLFTLATGSQLYHTQNAMQPMQPPHPGAYK